MHEQNTDLSETIVASLSDHEVQSIILQANQESLSAGELHKALVIAGVALGVEKVQAHTVVSLNGQVTLLNGILKELDEKAGLAAGNDEMITFYTSLRAPIAEQVRKHLDNVISSFANSFGNSHGIERETLMSRAPLDEIPDKVRAAGISASMDASAPFYGFILTPDTAAMRCDCMHCLTRVVMEAQPSVSQIIGKAVERFGSFENAMHAYGLNRIQNFRKMVAQFEEGYGNLDGADTAQASAATDNLLAKWFGSGGNQVDHDIS